MKALYDELLEKHQALQREEMAEVTPGRIERVKAYVAETVAAGAKIADNRQREQLRSILRYWSAWVYDQTKEFPPSQLVPYSVPSTGNRLVWPRLVTVGGMIGIILLAGLALAFFLANYSSRSYGGGTATAQAVALAQTATAASRIGTSSPHPISTAPRTPTVPPTLTEAPTLIDTPINTTPTGRPKLIVVQKLLLDFSSLETLPSGPLDVPPTAETSGMIQFVNVSDPHVWVLVCRRGEASAPCAISTLELSPEGTWSSSIAIGSPRLEDDCAEFDVIFAVVDSNTNSEFTVRYPPESAIKGDQVPWERFLDSQLIQTKRGLSADGQPICK